MATSWIRSLFSPLYTYLGQPQPQRGVTEFEGDGVSVADDLVKLRTVVTITGTPTTPNPLELDPISAPTPPGTQGQWKIWADSSGALMAADAFGRTVELSQTMIARKTITLSANNTAAIVNLFQLTGSIKLPLSFLPSPYGIVKTTIGSNHTLSKFTLYDGTTSTDLGTVSGDVLSSAPVGTLVVVGADGGTHVISATDSVATLGAGAIEGLLVAKHGATTYIRYGYSTTDTPTSGQIEFIVEYQPVSDDGALTPA